MADMTKILVIGIDAATFDLIDPWMDQGLLPNLKRLVERGTRSVLWSVPNMNSAPAWTSFSTGKNPGSHGIYYFVRRKENSYASQVINGSFRDGSTFWQIASQYGKQVGIINVPMTYPADPVNGFLVSGVDTPGSRAPNWTFPRDLMEQMPKDIGEYIVECGLPSYMTAGQIEKGLETAYHTIAQRTRYSRYLLENYPWDIFVTVYTTIDVLQHYFWKYMCLPQEPSVERFSQAIQNAYIRVDQAIGDLVQSVPPETTVIILSDHGAGPALRAVQELPAWLVEQGFISIKKAGQESFPRAVRRSLTHHTYHWLDAHLPRETKLFIGRLLPGLRSRVEAQLKLGQIDWERSRVYIDGSRVELRVNLEGREPQGIVKPGQEYESLRDELIAQLLEWRDPESNVRWVADVKRREDIYTEPYLAEAADLLIRWNYASLGPRHFSFAQATNDRADFRPRMQAITGGHRPNGILICCGPSIQSGKEIPQAFLWDIAPTILYLSELPIPADMDGHLLQELFSAESLEQFPPHYDKPEQSGPGLAERPYGNSEEDLLKQRLRGLGYID